MLRAVEGSVGVGEPTRRGGSHAHGEHAGDLSELWREVSEAVSAVVDRVTLEDLRRRAEDAPPQRAAHVPHLISFAEPDISR